MTCRHCYSTDRIKYTTSQVLSQIWLTNCIKCLNVFCECTIVGVDCYSFLFYEMLMNIDHIKCYEIIIPYYHPDTSMIVSAGSRSVYPAPGYRQ